MRRATAYFARTVRRRVFRSTKCMSAVCMCNMRSRPSPENIELHAPEIKTWAYRKFGSGGCMVRYSSSQHGRLPFTFSNEKFSVGEWLNTRYLPQLCNVFCSGRGIVSHVHSFVILLHLTALRSSADISFAIACAIPLHIVLTEHTNMELSSRN